MRSPPKSATGSFPTRQAPVRLALNLRPHQTTRPQKPHLSVSDYRPQIADAEGTLTSDETLSPATT